MNSYAGLHIGAGGGQPLPKVPWTPQPNSPPSIPNLDDVAVPGCAIEQFPPSRSLPPCFPPPGLGEESDSSRDPAYFVDEFARNQDISKTAPSLRPSGFLAESQSMSTSPLPFLLGRAQNLDQEKVMKNRLGSPPPGLVDDTVPAASTLARPPGLFNESAPVTAASQGHYAKRESYQHHEGEDVAGLLQDRQQLLAILGELQSLRCLSSQFGPQAFQAQPHWQGFSQQPIPSWSPAQQLLSTGAPRQSVCEAPLHPFPSRPTSSVLSAAVAGYSSGLPGAATIAAALSSAAHGMQVPRRQQTNDRSDSAIDFGPADVAAGIGPEKRGSKTCSLVPDSRDRGSAASSPVTPINVDKDSFFPGLEAGIDCFDAGSPTKNGRRFGCKFVFVGIDLDRDQDFEIVPRLIGRGGENMRQIAQRCNGKVRIRGRGSGHKEQQKGGKVSVEADVPLQIALSCKDRRSFEEGKQILITFLEGMCAHFERYCKRHRIEPVPTLYMIVADP